MWRTSEVRAAPRQPLDEQSRRNHDVIMIRMMTRQWRSAFVEIVSEVRARAGAGIVYGEVVCVDGDGWWVRRVGRLASADSRFLSLAVVPLGEDGGLQ